MMKTEWDSVMQSVVTRMDTIDWCVVEMEWSGMSVNWSVERLCVEPR